MIAGRSEGAGSINNQWVNDRDSFTISEIADLPRLAKTQKRTVTLAEYEDEPLFPSSQDQHEIFTAISKIPSIQRLVLDWDLDWRFNPNLVIEKFSRLDNCRLSELEIQMDHFIPGDFFAKLKTWGNLNKLNFSCASPDYIRNFLTPTLINHIQELKQHLKQKYNQDLSIFINGKKVDLEHEYKLAQTTPLFSPTAQVTAGISRFSFSAQSTTGRVTRTMCAAAAAVESKAAGSTPGKRKDSPTRDLDDHINPAKRPCTGDGIRTASDETNDVEMSQAAASSVSMFGQASGAGSSSGAGSRPGQRKI